MTKVSGCLLLFLGAAPRTGLNLEPVKTTQNMLGGPSPRFCGGRTPGSSSGKWLGTAPLP